MKVACELSALVKPRAGIRIYVEQLLAALRAHRDLRLLGYLPSGTPPEGVETRVGRGLTRRIPLLWFQFEGMRAILADEPDVFWTGLYTVPRSIVSRVPVVVTVHDVMWKIMPETMRLRTRLASVARARFAIENADRIVAVSRATADDVLRHYRVDPAKVRVIHSGVNPAYRPVQPGDAPRRYGLGDRYAIFVGTVEPRKNLERVLKTWNVPIDLAIVGAKGWKTSRLYRSGAKFLGYVPDEDLCRLYSGAEFFVFPSLYEGFGLPVLEAMACGCPVLTSNVSSLPEVAGDAALLVDPRDDRAMGRAFERLSEDRALRDRLRAAGLERAGGFSWKRTAEAYAGLFRELSS